MEKRIVWLNLNTGEFSNSWKASEYPSIKTEDLATAAADGWKLIEYSCINDEKFEFYDKMKIK